MDYAKCAKCGSGVGKKINECPECGAVVTKLSWMDNLFVIFGLLLFVFPLGLILLLKTKRLSVAIKIISTFVFGLLFAAMISSDQTSSESKVIKNAKPQSVTKQEIVAPVVLDISYYEIRNKMKQMTDMQKRNYAKNFEGKVIKWNGYVDNVSEKLFGGYEIQIDMEHPSDAYSVSDITFEIPESIAINLQKNSLINFMGEIESIMEVLGSLQVTLVNARVI